MSNIASEILEEKKSIQDKNKQTNKTKSSNKQNAVQKIKTIFKEIAVSDPHIKGSKFYKVNVQDNKILLIWGHKEYCSPEDLSILKKHEYRSLDEGSASFGWDIGTTIFLSILFLPLAPILLIFFLINLGKRAKDAANDDSIPAEIVEYDNLSISITLDDESIEKSIPIESFLNDNSLIKILIAKKLSSPIKNKEIKVKGIDYWKYGSSGTGD